LKKKAFFSAKCGIFFEEKHDFSDKIGIFFGKKVKLSTTFSKKR
jgi:hypothetical protein